MITLLVIFWTGVDLKVSARERPPEPKPALRDHLILCLIRKIAAAHRVEKRRGRSRDSSCSAQCPTAVVTRPTRARPTRPAARQPRRADQPEPSQPTSSDQHPQAPKHGAAESHNQTGRETNERTPDSHAGTHGRRQRTHPPSRRTTELVTAADQRGDYRCGSEPTSTTLAPAQTRKQR